MGGLNGLAVCAGIGGLELGLERTLVGYRGVCYVERDAYAAAVLVARMEEKALDPAPIFDSIESFDGVPWRGAVDILSAGFPCQPWSSAGRRQGTKDHRWLWPHILRVITECRPAAAFLENSPRLDVGGVRRTLLEIGYGSEAVRARASDVGAPHRRERVFILAYADGDGQQGERSGGVLDRLRAALRDDADRSRSADVAHADGAGLRVQPRRGVGPRWGETSFPPGPDDDWSKWDGPQPAIRRDPYGIPGGLDPAPYRTDRLRVLGNAVCPPQAEAALRWLLEIR